MTLAVPATKILVPGQSLEIAYGFEVPSGERIPRRLKWRIRSQLLQISASGHTRRTVASRSFALNTQSASEVSRAGFSYAPASEPGFYLVRTQFRRPDGTVLGRYGEYFRVVQPTWETVLVTDSPTVRLGDELAFKIENRGTSRIFFGESFSVEREANGQWRPMNLQLGPWHARRLGLGAGETGMCQKLDIVDRLRPGQYRVRKDLLSPPRRLEAEFAVAP